MDECITYVTHKNLFVPFIRHRCYVTFQHSCIGGADSGNKMKQFNKRAIQACYMSVLQFGPANLAKEDFWLPIAAVPSVDTMACDAGMASSKSGGGVVALSVPAGFEDLAERHYTKHAGRIAAEAREMGTTLLEASSVCKPTSKHPAGELQSQATDENHYLFRL